MRVLVFETLGSSGGVGSGFRDRAEQLTGLLSPGMATAPRQRLGAVAFRAGVSVMIKVSLSRAEFELIKVESLFCPKCAVARLERVRYYARGAQWSGPTARETAAALPPRVCLRRQTHRRQWFVQSSNLITSSEPAFLT